MLSLSRDSDLGKTSHSSISILLLVWSVVMFIVMAAFNGLAGSGAGIPDVFVSTVGNLSDKYDTMITPAGFTFSIWSIIYVWLSLSLFLLCVTLFLDNDRGKMYLNPLFASPLLTGFFSINFGVNIAWIFLWDREQLVAAFFILIAIVVSGMVIIGLMARHLKRNEELYTRESGMFGWGIAYRIIMNGWGVYITWCVIASLLNLTIALTYVGGTDMKSTCLAALSLLVIFHVTWFCLENFVLDNYFRWLLTPYIVVIWASNGIRANIMDRTGEPQEIKDFVLAILIIASLTLVLRLAIVAFRTFRDHKKRAGSIIDVKQ